MAGLMGPGTAVVEGQRFPMQTRAAWSPIAYGPSAQASALPNVSIPPVVGAPGALPAGGNMSGDSANTQAAALAAANPFSLKLSPTLWAVAFLLIGLIGLRLVHWRSA